MMRNSFAAIKPTNMRNRIIDYPVLNADLGALLLRLALGGMMIYFGYNKLSNYNQILPMFGDIIGIGSKLSFNLVIFAEFFCGIFVALGFLTRLSVIPILITMIVAYFIAHAKDTFQVKQGAFIYMILCLPVFVLGSGRYSVDALMFRRRF
jgi:putative oxidoreductase